jgi:hypothetical protein
MLPDNEADAEIWPADAHRDAAGNTAHSATGQRQITEGLVDDARTLS